MYPFTVYKDEHTTLFLPNYGHIINPIAPTVPPVGR